MRPNVEFRVDLPKTNPSLAKSHLQRHMATRKKTAPNNFLMSFFIFFQIKKELQKMQRNIFKV